MRARGLVFIVGGALAVATTARAQVLDRPEREGDPGVYARRARTGPSGSRSDLVAEVTGLGGYGDDLLTRGSGPLDPISQGSVYSGLASGRVRFSHGSTARSVMVGGSGFTDAGERRRPMTGGGADLEATQSFGRRDRLTASGHVNYVPYQGVGSAGTNASGVGAATSGALNPTYGSVANGSFNIVTGTNFNHDWSQADRSDVGYSFSQNSQSQGYETTIHTGSVQHFRRVARPTEIGAAYRYGQSDVFFGSLAIPMTQHGAEGVVTFRRRLTRTRTVEFTGSAGASRLTALDPGLGRDFSAWTPSGSASINLDLVRSWSVRADYRRGFALLPGVSTQAFASHTAFFNLGGLLAPRVDLAVTGNFSHGRGQAGASNSGTQRSLMLTTQLRVAMSSRSAFLASYSHYQYELTGVSDLAAGVPPDFNRHAVRVGVSLWLPLHSSQSGRTTGGRGRPAQPQGTEPRGRE